MRKHVAWILVAILNGDWTGDIIYYFEKHDCVSTHDDTVTLLLFFWMIENGMNGSICWME